MLELPEEERPAVNRKAVQMLEAGCEIVAFADGGRRIVLRDAELELSITSGAMHVTFRGKQ